MFFGVFFTWACRCLAFAKIIRSLAKKCFKSRDVVRQIVNDDQNRVQIRAESGKTFSRVICLNDDQAHAVSIVLLQRKTSIYFTYALLLPSFAF
jgi:hypothetical protein